jgi:hypothetical protein
VRTNVGADLKVGPYSRTIITAVAAIAIVMLLSPVLRGQQGFRRTPGAVYDRDFTGKKSGPAPRRDISGIWEFANGGAEGIQADGAKTMPSDGKPEHELPFTAEGRKAFMDHKPTFGITQVASALTNDPMPGCDPQGFPRIVLHNAHTEQIIQTSTQVVILYQFNKKWRAIWTDGRALPRNPEVPGWALKDSPPPEARFWGYSVGRWVDDYTFVADSNGFDDRSWLDNAGRPHSDALHVIETYHRVDADHMEKTITIDDPKYYSRPWVALDKLPYRLQSASLEIPEQECVPSETAKYNQLFANPAAGVNDGR